MTPHMGTIWGSDQPPKPIAIPFETGGAPDSHRCRLQRVIYTYVHEITLLEALDTIINP